MFFSLPLPFFISLSPFLSLLPRVLARAVRVRGGDRFIPVRCNGVKVDACYARFYPRPAHAHSRKSDRIDEPRRKKFQRLFLNFIPPCGQPEPDFGSRVDFARVSPRFLRFTRYRRILCYPRCICGFVGEILHDASGEIFEFTTIKIVINGETRSVKF